MSQVDRTGQDRSKVSSMVRQTGQDKTWTGRNVSLTVW